MLELAADGPGASDRARIRLEQLRHVTAALAAAPDMETVIELVVGHAKEALDATISSLALAENEDTLVVVGTRGGHPEVEARWPRYAVTAQLPVCEAFRTGEIVVASGRDRDGGRFGQLPEYWPDERWTVGVPLAAGVEKLGVIGLVFDRPATVDDWELQLLALFAETCSQVIVRIRAQAATAEHAARLALLSDAAAELSSSLDYRATLANVANLVVATLADWCAIDVLDDGVLRTVAVSHADPAKVALAHEFRQRFPRNLEARFGAPKVLRTGLSELYPAITDAMLAAAAPDALQLEFSRRLDFRSAMLVPLTARGRTLGVITLVSSDAAHGYDRSDLAIAEDLAARAALAIDNSQLYSQTREVALQLQRAVMPETLPEIAGWDVAAAYHPSGRTDVGGDFYDVVELPDGSIVTVLGDVMGRGVEAAATMAQLRSSVRAYIATDPDPDLVLAKLDRMFALYGIEKIVTMVYAVLDPATGLLRLANAGHPPPLLIDAAGSVRQLGAEARPPIGVGSEAAAWAHSVQIEAGATLLLYTDGLIERRAEDIDAGIARLSAYAPALRSGPLPAALEAMVEQVQDPDRDDDVAVLVLHRH